MPEGEDFSSQRATALINAKFTRNSHLSAWPDCALISVNLFSLLSSPLVLRSNPVDPLRRRDSGILNRYLHASNRQSVYAFSRPLQNRACGESGESGPPATLLLTIRYLQPATRHRDRVQASQSCFLPMDGAVKALLRFRKFGRNGEKLDIKCSWSQSFRVVNPP